MAVSKRALLLAAMCCAALASCMPTPYVKSKSGDAEWSFPEALAAAHDMDAKVGPVAEGDMTLNGMVLAVEPGASVTVDFLRGCLKTYGPGTHVIQRECDEDDEDQDHERDEDEGQDRQDRQDRQDHQDQPSSENTAPGDTGVMDTLRTAVTSTTGSIVTGAVIGALINEKIDDNKEEDREPVSP